MSKVLVLTASFGEGHNQAASAVAEALQDRGVTVKTIDYVEWLNPTFRSFAKFSLIQGIQKAPSLYGLFYKSMSRMKPDSSLQKRLNHLGMTRMMRHLRRFGPDAVVSTFPAPTGIVSELRELGWTDVPNVGILTDYTTHGQWVKEHVDLYFVPTPEVREELINRGVSGDKILAPGMPVRSKFVKRSSEDLSITRGKLRKEHGLREDLPLVLLMGGGAGLLGDITDWEKVFKKTNAQFAVICGRNERLLKKLLPLNSELVKILGYVTEVDEWMAMSDLIVTKAGGITVSECMTMELPMLVYRPIPGQEDRNAQFAIDSGFAVKAKDVRSARRMLSNFISERRYLEIMRENARRAKKPLAAVQIADEVLKLIEVRRSSNTTQSTKQRNTARHHQST